MNAWARVTDGSPGYFRAGSGTPLVLLHGIMCSWRIWKPCLPDLTAHHDVLALTLPGHRGGPFIDVNQATPAMVVDAVERVLDEQGIGTAHIAGNSFGGAISMELLRRGRAESVTAFSPGGVWLPDSNLRMLRLTFDFGMLISRFPAFAHLAAWSPTMRRQFLKAGCDHADRIPRDEVLSQFADGRYAAPLVRRFLGALDELALEPVDRKGVPVVLAWPDRDRVLPFSSYGLPYLERVPGSTLVRLPGVGHAPFYDNPDLVVQTILDNTGSVAAERSATA